MGEELNRNDKRPPEPPKRNSLPGGPGSSPGKSANRNPDAAAAGTGRTPAAAASGTGTGTGKAEEKEKLSGLAAVTPPPVPETPKKKQTRQPRQTKKQEPTSFNAEQLTALIVSLSSIVASRPGLDMFAISAPEAQQIATPLSNMIAKSESLKGLSEHADAIALVTACFVIMLPRVMLYFDAQKAKQAKAAGGVKLVRTDTEKGKAVADSRKHDGTVAPAVQNDVSSIYAQLPAIAD